MKTVFPYQDLDFTHYFQEYFKREDAIGSLPDAQELKDLARKAIVKDRMELRTLPEGTAAQTGDTLTLKTVSELPRFNKEKVTVSIGRSLYNRDLESALTGCHAGDTLTVTIQEKDVTATVLEIRRKTAPEPTDEMVAELGAKDHLGNAITTVADYEAFVASDKINSVLAEINYYTMTPLLEACPMTQFDDSDLQRLGELERAYFRKAILKQEGIDIETASEEQMRKIFNVASMDEFIAARREWYQMKIQQCYAYLDILGLPCEGKYDPLDHYEVLSELQMMMFEKIKNELAERNK